MSSEEPSEEETEQPSFLALLLILVGIATAGTIGIQAVFLFGAGEWFLSAMYYIFMLLVLIALLAFMEEAGFDVKGAILDA